MPGGVTRHTTSATENARLAVFHLFGEIKDSNDGSGFTLSRILDGMKCLLAGSDERRRLWKPVFLISSRGGSIEESLRIYSYLAHLPLETTTVAVGLVESAAIYVFLAGKVRIATPETTFYFHEGHLRISSGVNDLQAAARAETKKLHTQIDIIAKATGNRKQAARWLRSSHALTAHEAKHLGLVHEIEENAFFSGNIANVL